jgi:hypothetical protein
MRERVPNEEEPERAATPAARAEPPAAAALQLQQTAGNQATTQMVQRFGLLGGVGGGLLGLGGDIAFDYAWDKFVESNEEDATYFAPEPGWRQLALEYAAFNEQDGMWIKLGIKRMPDCWKGGWILVEAGAETHAITLDKAIFFNPATTGEPNVDTYVHELVHVAQYGLLGVQGFLGSYGIDYVKGLIGGGGDPDKAYHAIRHEKQAAAIEERFTAWRLNKEKVDAAKKAEEDAKHPTPIDPIKEAEEAMKPPSPISEVGGFPLVGSVGEKGENRPEDVERVAGRLHGLGFLPTMTTDIEKVTDAISEYQGRVLGWPRPDGRVDVNNKTHRALKAGRKTVSMAL